MVFETITLSCGGVGALPAARLPSLGSLSLRSRVGLSFLRHRSRYESARGHACFTFVAALTGRGSLLVPLPVLQGHVGDCPSGRLACSTMQSLPSAVARTWPAGTCP